MQSVHSPQKIFLKLQRVVIQAGLEINDLAEIVRLYADQSIAASSLYEELAF